MPEDRVQPEFPLHQLGVVTSTNDTILEAGAAGAPEGTTHLAEAQTRGRGRVRRSWWSPSGAGLWMSVLLRPTRDRAVWSGLSLVAGAAVRRTLIHIGVPDVELYWPNDLQVGSRKIGGILGEVRSDAENAWIAMGIGINIDFGDRRAEMPPEIEAIATSLVTAGSPVTTDPETIARRILENFWPRYEEFNSGRSIPELVGTDLAHCGRRVEVRTEARAGWRGVVQGLGAHGELLVERTDHGSAPDIVSVTAGEVIYEPPQP